MTSRDDVRAETRQFLTTRRAKLTPEQAGLPSYGGNRRVPGPRREEVGATPTTGALTDLVGELSMRSQAFRVGDLALNDDALELPADPGQTIVAYTAEPGSPAQHALDLLASRTATPGESPAVTSDTDT